MSKIPGYNTMSEFARAVGLDPDTVSTQMRRGVCQWPRKQKGISRCDHPLFDVWNQAVRRCTQQTHPSYPNYGGRGITISPEWQSDFWCFVSDMGARPEGYSLERIDNNQGYNKRNCRWASNRDQALNKRTTRIHPNIETQNKVKGVTYRGRIKICGKTRSTPTFDTVEEAQAHLETLKQLYKEYL